MISRNEVWPCMNRLCSLHPYPWQARKTLMTLQHNYKNQNQRWEVDLVDLFWVSLP